MKTKKEKEKREKIDTVKRQAFGEEMHVKIVVRTSYCF